MAMRPESNIDPINSVSDTSHKILLKLVFFSSVLNLIICTKLSVIMKTQRSEKVCTFSSE